VAKISHFLQEINTKYHITHIIEALTTGAQKPTKIVNNVIIIEITINLMYGGKNLIIYPKNIIKIVILKPETAII
jgi:hypothetical protein